MAMTRNDFGEIADDRPHGETVPSTVLTYYVKSIRSEVLQINN